MTEGQLPGHTRSCLPTPVAARPHPQLQDTTIAARRQPQLPGQICSCRATHTDAKPKPHSCWPHAYQPGHTHSCQATTPQLLATPTAARSHHSCQDTPTAARSQTQLQGHNPTATWSQPQLPSDHHSYVARPTTSWQQPQLPGHNQKCLAKFTATWAHP